MPYYFLSQDLELAEREKVELTNELENLVSQTHAPSDVLSIIHMAGRIVLGNPVKGFSPMVPVIVMKLPELKMVSMTTIIILESIIWL